MRGAGLRSDREARRAVIREEAVMSGLRMGEFLLVDSGEVRSGVEGLPIGDDVNGTSERHLFDVSGPEGVVARLAYVEWDNGKREVRAIARIQWGPSYQIATGSQALYESFIDRERMRLEICALGGNRHKVVLKQARIGYDGRPQLCKSSLEQLNGNSQTKCESILMKAGGLQFGTQSDVLGETGRNCQLYCVTYPVEKMLVPVAAFAITRILPVYYGVKQ